MEKLDILPESRKLLDFFSRLSPDLTVKQMRENYTLIARDCSGYDRPFDGKRTEIIIPTDSDGLPCYIYTPSKLAANPAILLYFHGGGLYIGDRNAFDAACKELSALAGCVVVNVEYHLAPEYKFPVQIDDAVQATKWVMENKTKIGALPGSKVGVGGDSAGGYLSASVTHELKVDFQILIYPMVTKFGEYSSSASARKYKDGPLVSLKGMQRVAECCLPDYVDMNHPRLNPITRPNFDTLPPALVLLAEHDFLVDSGIAYAEKLQSNGVPVELHIFKGAVHAFFGSFEACPKLCEDAFGKCASFIQKMVAA